MLCAGRYSSRHDAGIDVSPSAPERRGASTSCLAASLPPICLPSACHLPRIAVAEPTARSLSCAPLSAITIRCIAGRSSADWCAGPGSLCDISTRKELPRRSRGVQPCTATPHLVPSSPRTTSSGPASLSIASHHHGVKEGYATRRSKYVSIAASLSPWSTRPHPCRCQPGPNPRPCHLSRVLTIIRSRPLCGAY